MSRVMRLTLAVAVCAVLTGCGTAATSPGQPVASEQNVSFAVDGTTTYGTLDIPAHRAGQRLAAALLLAGSGPTDRNGDDPGAGVEPHTLQLIAGVLGRYGIMTLRFDKYFSGQTGSGAYAGDPGSITLAAFIHQADAAYGFLKSQPAADPKRLLVVGHSEGGMYALLVASSVTPRPAGLALLEPQDERLLSLVQLQTDEQLNAEAAQFAISDADAEQNAAAVKNAIAAFRAGRHPAAGGMLPQVVRSVSSILFSPVNAAYVRSDDDVYPPSRAEGLAAGTRVLVTDGTADTNVPPSTIGPLVTALRQARAAGPGLRMLPDVDHFLHLPGTAPDDQVLAPAFTAALRAWASPYRA